MIQTKIMGRRLKPGYGEKSFNSHSQDSVQGASQSDLEHFVFFMFFLLICKIYNSLNCWPQGVWC